MAEVSAKVATILDESKIVINVGTGDGVDVGDTVHLWSVVTVTDPDTNEALGTVRTRKLRLEITEVQDKLSIAQVYTPPFNFTDMVFKTAPEKTINSAARSTNSVSVKRGEEATVYVPDEDAEDEHANAIEAPQPE